MHWKPKTWIAVMLGLLAQPLAMFYVARPGWAAFYIAASLSIAVLVLFAFHQIVPAAPALLPPLLAIIVAGHAYFLAKNYQDASRPRPWYSRWYGLAAIAASSALAVGLFRAFAFEPFRFPSGSMLPSIKPGSYVAVKKWGYGNYRAYGVSFAKAPITAELARGDMLVFEYPEDRSVVYAKRLVGLPGDKVSYLGKRLSVNGNAVPVRQIGEYAHRGRVAASTQLIEKLGDNEFATLNDQTAPAAVRHVTNYRFREKCRYSDTGVECEVPSGQLFVLGDNRDASSDSRVWGFVPLENVIGKVVYISP
jgi:signal peptidase I